MLSVPSRAAQRLPHMTAHDVGEIDREIRDALVPLPGSVPSPNVPELLDDLGGAQQDRGRHCKAKRLWRS
jgi:hypothetical protein